jgi:hypothetical protein
MLKMKKTLWNQPELEADHFLYHRKGPWPQPSPTYPMEQAPEILNIPPEESLLWNQAIGSRYFKTLTFYPGGAAANAVAGSQLPIPSDTEFTRMMTNSVFVRSLRNTEGNTWVADFSPMRLIASDTLPGTYARQVNAFFKRNGNQFSNLHIEVIVPGQMPLVVAPGDPAWNLAKAYALQGASYIGLFVGHPALHFPMDSINAITKTAVPRNHPLFQLLFPHSTYALAVNNAVLETEDGILSNDPPGTWFDPLTASGQVIKRLFGAGYAGFEGHPVWYPEYNYMKPWMDESVDYGRCLSLYFQPFLTFCSVVAAEILKQSKDDTYVERWANYLSAQLHGFPDGKAIFELDRDGKPATLARAMAIYMWDVTVAHAADHYSFYNDITSSQPGPAGTRLAAWKFLRLRVPPPTQKTDGAEVKLVGDVCHPDDLYRAEMAQEMFFKSVTIWPNLVDTTYAFTSPVLLAAQQTFHAELRAVSQKVAAVMPNFMQLETADPKKYSPEEYSVTISASIQY